MEIEDLIDPKSRLEQGIFFTKLHIVDMIVENFDFSNIKSVLDSAAGSCNFLIALAIKYPYIQFYGIEKNPVIFNSVQKDILQYKNIHYFLGDALLDKFPIPKCDLYIGNPPFVNYSDLSEVYREKIKPIWLKYFPQSRGFKMLLGDSRGDIAQLIFCYTIDNYLKDSGEIGVILPNSLIKGNSASAGFREFNNVKVNKLVDISFNNPFDNTSRNCFYFLGVKGKKTTYPINYVLENRVVKLVKNGQDLIEEGTTILRKSYYFARQGVNTLGANSVFIFKSTPSFDSVLLKPLLKSSDINAYSYNPSYLILFPYKDGKLIDESELESNYPNAYTYLLKSRDFLMNRKSRFVQKCWYTLFGVGDYTCSKYKVVWRGLGAKELMACVTTDVIPNQAMNCYISTETINEAYFICGIMNSTLYKEQLKMLNEEGAKSFAQPSTINKIFIPKYNNLNLLHIEISKASELLHKSISPKGIQDIERAVRSLYLDLGFNLNRLA